MLRTFRVVDQKTTQLVENQKAMPLSSNRAESKTPLFILVVGKEATNNLKIFSSGNTKVCYKKEKNTNSSRVALTNTVQGTKATCR
jgi:hypothetical protein